MHKKAGTKQVQKKLKSEYENRVLLTVLDGVLEGENSALGLSFIAHISILLAHADHYSLVAGTTNDGGKHCTRSVVSSETSLAHSRTVVHNEGLNFFVAHFLLIKLGLSLRK